jgi:hypothetical protein
MVIDVILDRQYFEERRNQGVTHFRGLNGEIIENRYNPSEFYSRVREYGEIAFGITAAMDYGTEEDVRRELCAYVHDQGYPENICEYIRSRTWLS